MTRIRLLAAIPLAVLVALVAHAIGFGTDHTAGGALAGTIVATTTAALALCALVATLAAALFAPRTSIATPAAPRKLWVVLAAGGFAAYAGIEGLEGHAILAGAWALLAIVPTSFLVDVAVCELARRCGAVGRAIAALVAPVARGPLPGTRVPALVPVRANDRARDGARRGRAPPLHR